MFRNQLFRLLPNGREVWGYRWFGDYLYVIIFSSVFKEFKETLRAPESTYFSSVQMIGLDHRQNKGLSQVSQALFVTRILWEGMVEEGGQGRKWGWRSTSIFVSLCPLATTPCYIVCSSIPPHRPLHLYVLKDCFRDEDLETCV